MNQKKLAGTLSMLPATLAATASADAQPPCCPVIELRQYEMHPGQREALVSLFEDKFIEGQEEVGISVVGQFRDVRRANGFTWVRGFASMDARKKALGDFYYGPLWQANRDAANATLKDNDNVLLLRPASANSGFATAGIARPARGAAAAGGFVVATIYYFEAGPEARFINHFTHEIMPVVERAGARIIGRFVSEKSPNTFERLPVRENDNVFVWFGTFADRAAYHKHVQSLNADPGWAVHASYLAGATIRAPEILLLEPTPRSLVR